LYGLRGFGAKCGLAEESLIFITAV